MAAAASADTKVFMVDHRVRVAMLWTCGVVGGANAILGFLMLLKLSFAGAALFGFLASVMLLITVHSLSARVEIGPEEIVYRSFAGTKVLKLRDVELALPQSIRGVIFLRIVAGENLVLCSTYSFSREQLSEMQALIKQNCGALSKDVMTYRSISDRDLINFGVIYLLGIMIIGAAIIIIGTHNLHGRGLR